MADAITPNHSRPRLPVALHQKIAEIAARRGVSQTEVLRAAITRGLMSFDVPILPPSYCATPDKVSAPQT